MNYFDFVKNAGGGSPNFNVANRPNNMKPNNMQPNNMQSRPMQPRPMQPRPMQPRGVPMNNQGNAFQRPMPQSFNRNMNVNTQAPRNMSGYKPNQMQPPSGQNRNLFQSMNNRPAQRPPQYMPQNNRTINQMNATGKPMNKIQPEKDLGSFYSILQGGLI